MTSVLHISFKKFKMTEANPNSLKADLDLESINDYCPNEILEEILNKLSSKHDLFNAKLVCHRWRFIVDEMVGHDITVTNYRGLIRHLPYEDWKPSKSAKDVTSLDNYQNLAIRDLTIGVPGMLISESLTSMIERITKELSDFPSTPYPHVLKSLSCYEPLPPNIFNALSPMGNLQYLNISLFSLANLKHKHSFQTSCTFRCLSSLIISDSPAYPEFNSATAISPLNNFLIQVKAPKLAFLDVTYPILSLLEIEEDSTRYIINLIKRSSFMKKLSITVCSPNQNFAPPGKGFEYPASLMDEMETLGKRIKLESIELKDNHLHSLRPSVQTKAWIIFIKQQANLKSLKFYLKSSIEFVQDVIPVLERNTATLVNLDLSCFPCEISEIGDVYFVPIDGRTLTECASLNTLKLSDKTVNTTHLPSSLSYVYVDAMMTNLDAHNLLMSENFNLKQIDLKDTRGGAPKGFGYGVTLETLRQFVKKRTVERLVIYAGSTDEKFPAEGIPNEDEESPKQLRKQKFPPSITQSQENLTENQIRIDWKLNSRGFYENNNYDAIVIRSSVHSENEDIKQQDPHHTLYKCNTLFSTFH